MAGGLNSQNVHTTNAKQLTQNNTTLLYVGQQTLKQKSLIRNSFSPNNVDERKEEEKKRNTTKQI